MIAKGTCAMYKLLVKKTEGAGVCSLWIQETEELNLVVRGLVTNPECTILPWNMRNPVLSKGTYLGTAKNLELGRGEMRSCCSDWGPSTVPAAHCGPWTAVAARDRAAPGQRQSQPLEGAMNMKHHPVNFEKTAAHAWVSHFCTTLYFPKFSANSSYIECGWKASNI